MTKICVICGAEFEPKPNMKDRQKYCSKDCQRLSANARMRAKRAELSSVGKSTICKICGREYIKEYSMHVYCSDACKTIGLKQNQKRGNEKAKAIHAGRDRSRIKRGSQEYSRDCIVCGKSFTTWLPQKKTCSDECKAVHKKERDRSRKRMPEKEHERWIIRRYGSEENYKKWLAEQDVLRQRLKQKREQEREQERKARKEAYGNQLEARRIAREARKEANHRIGTCVVCGNSFDTYNPAQKTCSKECGKRLKHAHKHKRIPKKQLVDKDITLEALYKRDSGVCYLCGKLCDWNDKDGNVVGSNYPSIDHMIPISRGGLHAWTNVKLAHFECNWKKSDDLPPSFSSTG